MSNPLALFRRYQKSLLAVFGVLIIFVFVVGGYLQKALDGGGGNQAGNETVVSWKYGNVDEREIERMQQSHMVAARFVAAIVAETQERDGTPKAMQIFMARSEEDVFATFMLAEKAKQMGLVVSDDAVRDWLFRLSDEVVAASEFDKFLRDVAGERFTERQLFDQLQVELLAQNMRMLAFSGVTAITPSSAWDYHRRLNRRVSTEMLPLEVVSYTDKVEGEPTDAEIKKLFEKYKNDFPFPDSPTPGFRQRQKIAFQYFKVEFEKYLQEEMKNISEEAIKAEYKQRIAKGQYKITENPAVPAAPGGDFEAPPAPETSATSDDAEAQPKGGEAKDAPTTPAGDEKDAEKEGAAKEPEKGEQGRLDGNATLFVSAPLQVGDQDPKTDDPKTDDPKTDDPKTDDPKTDDPKTDDPKTDDPKTDDPKTDDPKTDDPKTDDPKTDDPKTDDPKTDDPKTDDPKTDDPKTDDPKTDDPKTDDPKMDDPKTDDPKTDAPATQPKAEDQPKTKAPAGPGEAAPEETKEDKFQPLEEVRDEIARSLAQSKAREKRDAAVKEVRKKIDRYSQKFNKWEALKEVKKDLVEPPAPDFDALAATGGFTIGETRLLDALEVSETEIGRSFRFSMAGGQFQTLQFAQIAFQAGVPRFKTDRIDAAVQDVTFVFWRTDEEEERVPELDDVRADVVVAWKMEKALELAEKDADEIRKQVADGGKSLRDAVSKEQAETVIEPLPFTWMSMGNVAMSRMATPQITRINRVDAAGHDFMEAVFSLQVGEVGVAVNNPKTSVYVVRVMGESPSLEMQREQFIDAGLQFQELQLSQMDRQTFFRDWYDQLNEEMKVVWKREAVLYR